MPTERSAKIRRAILSLPTRFETRDVYAVLGCADWRERKIVVKRILYMVKTGELIVVGKVDGRRRFHVYEKAAASHPGREGREGK